MVIETPARSQRVEGSQTAMTSVPPYQRAETAIRDLLRRGTREEQERSGGGGGGAESVTSVLMRLGLEALLNRALEEERTDFLGRERYERAEQPERVGYRNGYKPGHVDTAEGRVPLAVPQVRETAEPFHAQTLDAVRGRTAELERLVVEMYARGLSTRDIEDAFRAPQTGACTLSRTAVSSITEALWDEYEAFPQRDLAEFPVLYVFLDALYEALRRQGRTREGLLCAWAICADGRKVLLHLAVGNRESYESWREFLRDLVKRGLPTPLTVTTDGAPGLLRAVDEVWPKSLRVRCWAHKMRNVLAKVPEEAQAEVKAHLEVVRDAPTPEAGRQAAEHLLDQFGAVYPAAMRCFSDDLDASLAHLELPLAHRKFVRTTNLIERSFEEERRRTKTLPRFFSEHSGLKLAFAVLWRASQRWQRVRISSLERKQLDLLRQRLGIAVSVSAPDHPALIRQEVTAS
jgi:putative transposase